MDSVVESAVDTDSVVGSAVGTDTNHRSDLDDAEVDMDSDDDKYSEVGMDPDRLVVKT